MVIKLINRRQLSPELGLHFYYPAVVKLYRGEEYHRKSVYCIYQEKHRNGFGCGQFMTCDWVTYQKSAHRRIPHCHC